MVQIIFNNKNSGCASKWSMVRGATDSMWGTTGKHIMTIIVFVLLQRYGNGCQLQTGPVC